MKFVFNACYGGFGLSKLAVERLKELNFEPVAVRIKGETDENFEYRQYESFMDKHRSHPLLVQVVEELNEKANSYSSNLQIAEIDIEDFIDTLVTNHDGFESLKWPAMQVD